MHLFVEVEGDLKNYSELTYTNEAEGMPRAIWFVSICAQPFIDFVRGLHLTHALAVSRSRFFISFVNALHFARSRLWLQLGRR